MKRDPTVTIIGAGIGGLSLGAYLAKRGVRVTMFDARDRVGGFVHSFERGGYTFEASTHQIGGFGDINYMTRVFELLGVEYVPTRRLSMLYETCFLDDQGKVSQQIALPTDPDEIIEELIQHFPSQREALREYLAKVEGIALDLMRLKRLQREKIAPTLLLDAIAALMLKKGKPGGIVRKMGAKHYPHLVANINSTWADVLGDFDGRLRALLSQMWFYIGVPPSESPAVIAAIIFYLFFRSGGGRVLGGTAQLVEGLARTITDNGGEIQTGTPVRAIVVEKGRARGVVTADGRSHFSDRTVSNISSQRTFLELVGEHKLPPLYSQQIKALRLSRSLFQLFVGARLRLEDYGFNHGTVFFDAKGDVEQSAREGESGPTDRSPFMMVNYSIDDESFAPEGSSSLIALEYDDFSRWEGLSDDAYRRQKQTTQDFILEKLERATGASIREHADVLFSGTPITFNRITSGLRGEVFGPAATMDQALMKRTPSETPIDDLFLVGSNTQPAHGVSAVMDAAIVLGRTLAKDLL